MRGYARYTYRLRVSAGAEKALLGEWDRCRWVWNECVATSKAVHLHNKATGQKQTCGPAGGISLTVVWSRDLPAGPYSVRVCQDGVGHWYCSFVVPSEIQPLPATGRVLGVDWGVKETATTTSDDHDLAHAGHG